ncbi:MAG: hypothetical protein EAZ97_05910 [Bacteroidetes bacterium]|nr:MAG: hypothetical protein EAZ97_05910 [Bacteroidota bacterium]
MKKVMILCLSTIIFSCGNSKTEQKDAQTEMKVGLADGHYEYLFVQDKDSSFLKIDVKGAEVTGNYTFLPEVSDGAVGEMKAKQANNQVVGVLSFVVEGNSQSEIVYFDIKGADLHWKRYELMDGPKTKTMPLLPDTTKLVDTQKFVLKK